MAASAATLAQWTPKQADLLQSGQGVLSVQGTVGHLEFDPDTSWRAVFNGYLPGSSTTGYSATTGVKAVIAWRSHDAATTGAVVWAAQFALYGATDKPDPYTDIWSTTYEASTTTTVNSTAGGINYTTCTITITNMQGGQTTAPAIGDFFRLSIRRNGSSASDTMAGRADVLAVYLYDY